MYGKRVFSVPKALIEKWVKCPILSSLLNKLPFPFFTGHVVPSASEDYRTLTVFPTS